MKLAAVSTPSLSGDKNPAGLAGQERLSVDERFAAGLTHYYDGDFAAALKVFEELQTVVENERLIYLSALCQSRIGNAATARATLKALLRQDPGHQAARIALIEHYADSGNLSAAIQQMRYFDDESVDDELLVLLDRLKLRIYPRRERSRYHLSIEQGLHWNSNINAGSEKSKIIAPSGKVYSLDEDERAIGDWGTTTHLYGWYRYDPASVASLFWDTSASLYHVRYADHDEYDYTKLRLKTGPAWKIKPFSLDLPAGLRVSWDDGYDDYQEKFIHPVLKYTLNKHWAIKSAFYLGFRTYENPSDKAYDKFIRRFDIKPIWRYRKTSIAAGIGLLSACARESRYSYHGVEASLFARHKLTKRTRMSVRYRYRIKHYDGIYSGWFDKREDRKNSIHATVTHKIGKAWSLGGSFSWTSNHSNTELYEYERYKVGLNLALKF